MECEGSKTAATVENVQKKSASFSISKIHLSELRGILSSIDNDDIEYIAAFSYSQVRGTLDLESFARNQSSVAEFIEHLTAWGLLDDEVPDVLRFALMCHDGLKSLDYKEVAQELGHWIKAVCHGSDWTVNGIRGSLPRVVYKAFFRPFVEVAWLELPSGSLHTEAYVVCGNIRHRVGIDPITTDRHQALTEILDDLAISKQLKPGLIDHVQVAIEIWRMHAPWEYRRDELSCLQSFPIAVRCIDNHYELSRHLPPGQITEFASCAGDPEKFYHQVRERGAFVTSIFETLEGRPSAQLTPAIERGTVGIWTRGAVHKDAELRKSVTGLRIDQIPRRVDDNRRLACSNSLWQQIVLLFDPNLPTFVFSHEAYDSENQEMTNQALE